MQSYDLLMLTILAATTLWGLWKGLAWQVASLAALVVSYLAAMQFRSPVANLIAAEPPWNMFAGMLAVYASSSAGIWMIFRFVSQFIGRLKLKEFDRQVGAVVGFVKGGLVCLIVTFFALSLSNDAQRQTIVGSYSGRYMAIALDKADGVLPEEIHKVVGPYLHKLEDELTPGGQPSAAHHAQNDPPGGGLPSVFTPAGAAVQPPGNPAAPAIGRSSFTTPQFNTQGSGGGSNFRAITDQPDAQPGSGLRPITAPDFNYNQPNYPPASQPPAMPAAPSAAPGFTVPPPSPGFIPPSNAPPAGFAPSPTTGGSPGGSSPTTVPPPTNPFRAAPQSPPPSSGGSFPPGATQPLYPPRVVFPERS